MDEKPKIDPNQHLSVCCPNCMAEVASQSRFCRICGKDFFNPNSNPLPPSHEGWPQTTAVTPHPARLANIRKAHIHILVFVAVGVVSTAVFLWGFFGFLMTSDWSPPSTRVYAFWTGGVAYLVLLLFATTFSGSGDAVNNGFGLRAKKNLKWTAISLLLCFPAALLFIGFVAPPFIFAASVIGLLRSLFQEPIEDAAEPRSDTQGSAETLSE